MSLFSIDTKLKGAIIIIGLLWHWLVGYFLTSPLASILLVSLIVTWTIPKPFKYLVFLALFAELMATSSGGLVTLVVFMPWLAKQIFKRVEVDVSLTFAAILVFSILGQLLVVSGVDLYLYQEIPLIRLIVLIFTLSTFSFLSIIFLNNRLPVEQRSIISLEGYRLHD